MNNNEKLVANSSILDGVARVTVVGTYISVAEARDVARHEGARLLGLTTGMVTVTNRGWSQSGEAQYAFYQVFAS